MIRKNKAKKRTTVLHVGNIANNAYNNAKMLNKVGYDCDVFCPDYYHIMGCPEWEDAEFDANKIRDTFFPDWKKADIKNFRRPKWFVSGPLIWARKYIIARRKKQFFLCKLYWWCLVWARNDIVKTKDPNNFTLGKIEVYLNKLYLLYKNIVGMFLKLIAYILSKVGVLKWVRKHINFKERKPNKIFKPFTQTNIERIKTIEEIEEDFQRLFPDRKCEFGEMTIAYRYMATHYIAILEKYDIAVMYATNPIIAYLIGFDNYIAYEHGTIRDIPYEDSDIGRLTLLAYANAKAVYVTNIDCYDSAKYITQNSSTPIICGLHGIDINHIINKMKIASKNPMVTSRFGVPKDITLFFCPSRHDYDSERKAYLKGEDKILHAAKEVAKSFRDFKIVLVEWGNDIHRIKQMVKEYDLEKYIIWTKPINKEELYKVYQSSDAVLDQFLLKVYGAITFEVLAAQHSVLISNSVREDYQKKFFEDTVPYFACGDEAAISEAMKETILKTEKYKRYAFISRKWLEKNHSNKRIVDKLEMAFQYCNI